MNRELKKRHDAIIRFYNFVAEKEVSMMNEIPEHILMGLMCLEYIELVKPFIVSDIQKGKSMMQISIRYGLTKHEVRGIGRKQYLYSSGV